MKKLRLEKNHPTTTSISQKRGSLNQQQLFVPYKVDWRAASPINSENNNPSKAFFQNMKAELCTIKNDFQKLIRKEINLKIDQNEPLKTIDGNKVKSYSTTARKEVRSTSEHQKYQLVMKNKEPEEPLNRIMNLQKNLPCSSGAAIKQALVKTLNVRQNKLTTSSQFNTVKVEDATASSNYTPKDSQIFNLKEKIIQLQAEVSTNKDAIVAVKEDVKRLQDQKMVFMGRLTELSEQLSFKNKAIHEKDNQIAHLNEKLTIISQQAYQMNLFSQNWTNQRNYLNQHLSELSFHHNQIRNVHQQAINENNQLRETVGGLQRFCEDLQSRCADIESDQKRKLEYLQKDIQSYQQREDMFTSQIQQLTNKLRQGTPTQQKQIAQQASSNVELLQQIAQLKNQVYHLNKQVAIEKDLHDNLAQKCMQKVVATNNMEQITHNFQIKIAQLVDQNVKFKTKVNLVESKMQSLALQNQSYLQQINLYQQRQKFQQTRRQLNATEWEQLTEQIEHLKEENRKLNQELSLQQFSKESQPLQSQGCISQDLIKLSFDQRTQIEELKEKIRSLTHKNTILNDQIQSYKSDNIKMKSGVNTHVEWSQTELSKRQSQTKLLKEFIFSIIVKKINKKQDEQEIEYYVKELQQIRRKMIV